MRDLPSARLAPLALLAAIAGCQAAPVDAAPAGALCPFDPPPAVAGPVHGVAADGRIDLRAADAWPDRASEPAPLRREEIAAACALEAACAPEPTDADGRAIAPALGAGSFRAAIAARCASGADVRDPLAPSWIDTERRAIPHGPAFERWAWHVRAVLASGGDCAKLPPPASPLAGYPIVVCDETGCWTQGHPAVACDGDVATVAGATRDCGRALARCDASSPTGCSDRAPTACEPGGLARCDGDVRLACDACGTAVYEDCAAVPGGRCVEAEGGASCASDVAPGDACDPTEARCDGDALRVCTLGRVTEVDCAKIGLARCDAGACGAR